MDLSSDVTSQLDRTDESILTDMQQLLSSRICCTSQTLQNQTRQTETAYTCELVKCVIHPGESEWEAKAWQTKDVIQQ